MRWLGLLGLVVTLAIFGLLARKQLQPTRTTAPAQAASAPASGMPLAHHPTHQQVPPSYKQALESALQSAARPQPDDGR